MPCGGDRCGCRIHPIAFCSGWGRARWWRRRKWRGWPDALGYQAVLCPPPFYFRGASVAGLAEFFRAVLDASPLPVLLYHIPQVTGVPISDELLDAIGGHERLAGVKDSSGDPQEMARLIGRFPAGSYLVGSDRLVAASLEAGGTGSISAAANVVPQLVAAVNRGLDRQPELTAVRSVLEDFGLGPAVKCILRDSGLAATKHDRRCWGSTGLVKLSSWGVLPRSRERRWIGREDDLPENLSRFQESMRLHDTGKRQRPIQDRADQTPAQVIPKPLVKPSQNPSLARGR